MLQKLHDREFADGKNTQTKFQRLKVESSLKEDLQSHEFHIEFIMNAKVKDFQHTFIPTPLCNAIPQKQNYVESVFLALSSHTVEKLTSSKKR